MKSLNKMIASAAAMATMCFGAKADNPNEVDFMPVQKAGEIEKIELVNGQLLVRCSDEAEIQGEKAPYVYVGTNTVNFAEDAFAQGGLTNLTQYVHAGNGKIYMTEKGKADQAWTTTVGAQNAALNGVKLGVTEVDPEQDPIAKAVLATANTNANQLTVVDGHVYAYVQDKEGKWILLKDNQRSTEDYTGGSRMNEDGATPEQILFANANAEGTQKILYVLATDNSGVKRIYTADGSLNRKEVDYLTMVDGKLVYQDHKTQEIKVYNPSATSNKEKTVNTASAIPADAKSVVVAGNNIYYATAKKLGCKTIGE